jgi:Fe-S-cluster-containing hydrogenase component 2
MPKYIEVNLDKCTACRICEYACSTRHFGEINPSKSRIKVHIVSRDFFFFPNVCQQCGNAPCVAACPEQDALTYNKATGATEVNVGACIGCRKCVGACPFGAMNFDRETQLADKCDLCGGTPQCVRNCYYGALEFKEVERTVADLGRTYVEKVKTAYLQEVTQ